MSLQIYGAVMKRQTMANLAKDMDTWIEKRDQLSRKIEILVKQKDNILQSEVCYGVVCQGSLMPSFAYYDL